MNDAYPIAEERSLRDYLEVLGRRRWVTLAFFLICFGTTVIGTFLMTPLYRANTSLIVEGENTNVLRADENASGGVNFNIYENYLETQMALIKSRAIAGKVSEEFKLDETERYRKQEGWRKLFQKHFAQDISLERLEGTRMITIAVQNPDPELAAKLANRLADVYSEDNLKRRALTFIRNQRMGALNSEFLRLQAQYDSLSKQFGPKYPAMIELRKQIEAMGKRIENERIGAEAAASGQAAPQQPDAELETALFKIQEDSVISSSRMNNIVIVDRAYTPKKPSSPKYPLNLLLGFGAGLVGGILLAFFIDYLDDTIKSYEDLKRHAGRIEYLGAIFADKGGPKQVDRLVEVRTESPSAEAYRLIRTALVWHIRKENKIKDLAVLSAGPGEGKTTVASNLAIALAQLGWKTLLVDTDIRRGRLHEVYEMINDRGIAHYLTHDLPLDRVVQATAIEHLSLVTCGESMISSSQLFSSPKMTEFIKKTRERFDIVVYDTPPLTIISDTAVLLSQISSSVLAVRSGVTSARVLPKSLSLIRESRTEFIGVILNDTRSSDNPYYNQYYRKRK